MTRTEKATGTIALILAVIALFGYLQPIASALGLATTESVDAKIETAVAAGLADMRADLNDWRRDDTEFWIQLLDFKANRGEANDFDMVLLESKLRLRKELLKK